MFVVDFGWLFSPSFAQIWSFTWNSNMWITSPCSKQMSIQIRHHRNLLYGGKETTKMDSLVLFNTDRLRMEWYNSAARVDVWLPRAANVKCIPVPYQHGITYEKLYTHTPTNGMADVSRIWYAVVYLTARWRLEEMKLIRNRFPRLIID